jgi:hypothetical protein
MPYWLAKERAEYCDPAEVGLLARPSRGPKLPDRLCAALLSLPPEALWRAGAAGLPGGCSCGVEVLPIGVARWSMGRGGRLDWAPVPSGFTLGDGGMASPSRGVRAPLEERAPGMAGRSSGTGLDMLDTELAAEDGSSDEEVEAFNYEKDGLVS